MQKFIVCCFIILFLAIPAIAAEETLGSFIDPADITIADHTSKPASTVIALTIFYYNQHRTSEQSTAFLPDDFQLVYVFGKSAAKAIEQFNSFAVSNKTNIIIIFLDENNTVDVPSFAELLCKMFQGDHVDQEQATHVAQHVADAFTKQEVVL